MYIGFAVSLALHAALLGWALFSIHSQPPLKMPEPTPVEVAVISEDDLVRLRQGDRSSKNLEAAVSKGEAKETPKEPVKKPPTPPPTPAAAAPPPPPPEPVAEPDVDEIAKKLAALPPPPKPEAKPEVKPEPKPEPKPDPAEALAERKQLEEKLKKAEAEAKAKSEADAKAKADAEAKAAKVKADQVARAKAAAEKRKADKAKADAKALADAKAKEDEKKDFASIINKALLDKTKPKPQEAAGGAATSSSNKGPVAGAPEGTDNRLTASQASMLGLLMKQAVQRCWNINTGLEGIDKIVVKIEIKLGPDGRLIGDPRVVSSGSGPLFQDMANSAVRALIQCQPYTQMPPEQYKGGWDNMILNFDPRQMF